MKTKTKWDDFKTTKEIRELSGQPYVKMEMEIYMFNVPFQPCAVISETEPVRQFYAFETYVLPH